MRNSTFERAESERYLPLEIRRYFEAASIPSMLGPNLIDIYAVSKGKGKKKRTWCVCMHV